MNTCGTSHRKSMKHRPELQWAYGQMWRPTRSGGRRYRWSHRWPHGLRRSPTDGETPLRKSNRSQRTDTVSKDVAQERRQCEWDQQTRPTPRKGGGQAQDIARERQLGPPPKRTRTPPRRSEGWNAWATPTWPQTEEQTRDRSRNPEGEEPKRETRTLVASARATVSSPAATGRKEKHQAAAEAQPEYFQAQKKACWQEEIQRRWPWKRIHSQGNTMERSKNFRRQAASARTTRKEGAGGCRAQRGAFDRGSNPTR